MASTREPQIVWKCKYCSEEVNRKNALMFGDLL